MKGRLLKIAFVVAFLAMSVNAQAAVITYQFTGVVTNVAPTLVGGFDVGETVVGSFDADTIAIPNIPTPPLLPFPGSAIYAATNLQVTVGGDYTVSASNGRVFVLDHPDFDMFSPIFESGVTGPIVNGMAPTNFDILLTLLPTALSSADLPLAIPLSLNNNPGSISSDRSNFLFASSDANRLSYHIESIQPVPLPASAVLFASGVASLWGYAHRRNRGGVQ